MSKAAALAAAAALAGMQPQHEPEIFKPLPPAVYEDAGGGIHYPLYPKQSLALESEATEILYGGAAGGGKSHLMRVAAIRWSLEIPGLQTFLFRRLYADLKQNHMEGPTSFPELLAPLIARKLVSIIQGEIQFWNGAKIFLKHCQNENSLNKYQGAEIHLLLFDELTHFTEAMYRFLRGRMRVTGIDMPEQYRHLFPRVLSGANPGGVGHHWVKKTFVDAGAFKVWRAQASGGQGGLLRQFIPARLEDNPALTMTDPTYVERLEGLGDPMLVRAMKEGDWDVVAGSMFGDSWRRFDLYGKPWHVIAGWDAIPATWEIWRGADDGYASPAACYWFTQDPDTKTIYVIDELYRTGMLPEQFAEEVIKRDRAIPLRLPDGSIVLNNRILSGLLDSNAFSNTGQADISRAAAMNKLGANWRAVDKGSRSRVERVQHLHRLLAPNPKDPQGRPGIQFWQNCVNAIRTIPVLPRDKKDPEDVDTNAEDHPFDGVTYGLKYKRTAVKLLPISGI